MIYAVTHAAGEAVAELAVLAVQSIAAVRIAVITEIIRACSSTAVNWVVDGTGRASSECHVVSWEGILGGGRS
jgi:hypothetical protein